MTIFIFPFLENHIKGKHNDHEFLDKVFNLIFELVIKELKLTKKSIVLEKKFMSFILAEIMDL